MSLRDQILADITVAMKARDQARLDTLRMVKTSIQRQEIEDQKPMDDPAMMSLLNKLVKQRREAADAFIKGSRQELADKELAEAAIIEAYLPKPVDEATLAQVVESVIAETGASSAKEIGMVMKQVMAKLAGQNVDGKAVNMMVRSKLGG
ncbi:MAG TPA: GatB/YqeY domain-containing protein [Acidobacteriota bacterium]|nr:GatB/YqeY domain-containing protein [Acidobacteriota bacterium]HNH81128.1 GatB/YqeY domain-containing protein [Acidobacteriota bacterium]